MPPRRAKKPAKESSSGSESDHEASKPSIVSKITSKLKSVVGLESEPEPVQKKPAAGAKKRKRASAIERRNVEEEETAATPLEKKALARKTTKASATKTNAHTPSKPAAKRTRKSVVVEQEPSSPESSEDEMAVAPVSPVKPRTKGKAKGKATSTTTPPQKSTTRKPASANARKSTAGSTKKTRKTQDEYDSSIRELSHSSDSATPSEDSNSRASADYDPKIDSSRNKRDIGESDEEEAALETMEVDSEALDDESDFGPHKIAERASVSPVKKKAGRETGRKSVGTSGRKSVGKGSKKKKESSSEEEYESDEEEGSRAVGKIVKAPETGRVPPGQISQNTFDFLMELQDPDKNDREWFKLHDPVFRLAEKEWIAFVEAWVTTLTEIDDEVPPLPPKDIIHRIYRDVRFSNDKTPYKRNFCATTSRSGRKGIFAVYHLSIKPGGGSILAGGVWCPAKNELQSIRNVIYRNHGRRLRQIIAAPSFVKMFGQPKSLATKGKERKRQSIFGAEDELKVAPTGVDKNHRDIDLLKCRSFAVVHKFTDAQVLHKDFLEKSLRPVLEELRPFVHCLNDYMTVPLDDMSHGSSSSSDNE